MFIKSRSTTPRPPSRASTAASISPSAPIDIPRLLVAPPCPRPRRPVLPRQQPNGASTPAAAESAPASDRRDDEGEEALRRLQLHFDAEGYELPRAEGSEKAQKLAEREMMFLSRETLIRYLLATNMDVEEAISRLESTIVWRRTEQIDEVETLAERYKYQNRKGKGIVLGFTPQAIPIVYSFINRNPTPVHERRGVDTTFMLERATDLMVDGVSETLFVFQYGGEKMGESSTLSTTRDMLHIISTHYPRKISLATFNGMPWIVRTATNVVWPFVDQNTRDIVRYDKDLVGDGDVEYGMLLKACGGGLDYEYHHETYWDTLIRTCLDRRQDQLERWRALGQPQTGREESLFKVRPQ